MQPSASSTSEEGPPPSPSAGEPSSHLSGSSSSGGFPRPTSHRPPLSPFSAHHAVAAPSSGTSTPRHLSRGVQGTEASGESPVETSKTGPSSVGADAAPVAVAVAAPVSLEVATAPPLTEEPSVGQARNPREDKAGDSEAEYSSDFEADSGSEPGVAEEPPQDSSSAAAPVALPSAAAAVAAVAVESDTKPLEGSTTQAAPATTATSCSFSLLSEAKPATGCGMAELEVQRLREELEELKAENFLWSQKVSELRKAVPRSASLETGTGCSHGPEIERLRKEVAQLEALVAGYQKENEKLTSEAKELRRQLGEVREAMAAEVAKKSYKISELEQAPPHAQLRDLQATV
eukprot:RCo037513